MPKRNSNLLCRTNNDETKRSASSIYEFMKISGDNSVTRKGADFRKPVLKKSESRWYVEYYFRVPSFVTTSKKWERFRITGDINEHRNSTSAEHFRQSIEDALKNGFNPFALDYRDKKNEAKEVEEKKEWTIQQALLWFLQKWPDRGLDPESIAKYTRAVTVLTDWLRSKNLLHSPIQDITTKHVEDALADSKRDLEWGNRYYNNMKDYLRTAFKYLVKNKIAPANIIEDIDKLKVKTRKHRAYDDDVLKRLMDTLQKEDPYLHFAAQVVYHLCLRSEKELSLFKVGDIIVERKQARVSPEDAKGGMGRYIPLSDEIIKVFEERSILSYPKDYYVFAVSHQNKFVKDGAPGPEPFGRGFFSKRFSRIRKMLNLSSDYTLYGMKHTRAVHLKLDGASDAQIMVLMGHTDIATTAKYLRDLGLFVDADDINKLTRKI